MADALYLVRPLPAGLYELTGPTLPYPQRYRDDCAALNYAAFHGARPDQQGHHAEL